MAGERVVKIKFRGDSSELSRASAQGQKQLSTWQESFKKWNERAVKASLAVMAGAVGVGKELYGLASEAEQSLGAVDAVFGRNAEQVKKWSQNAAENLGLSANAYRELATVTGAQLKNMGVPMDQVAGKTNDLIKLGADLAATYGGTTAEAVEALGALLRGETDPIERYGVSIREADIAARMAADGTDKLEGAEAKAARTRALMALLTEQTADAQGQFARESNTAAGQAQRAQAKWEDFRTELGMQLLPVFTRLMNFLAQTVMPWLERNRGVVERLGLAVVGLAGFVLSANAAWKVYTAIARTAQMTTTLLTGATKLLTLGKGANTAATAANTTATGVNTAAQRAGTASIIANRVATTANTIAKKSATAATTLFTVAKKALSVATLQSTGRWIANTAALVANRVATTAARAATLALRGAQLLLNAALRASPLGKVLSVLGLVAGALVTAYQKSETFRRVVRKAFKAASEAVGWIIDKFETLVGWIKDAIDWVGDLIDGLLDAIGLGGEASEAASGSHVEVKGKRASGGLVQPNSTYLVGEKGPELLTLGARAGYVTPNHELGGGNGSPVYVTVMLDGQPIQARVKAEVREQHRAIKRGVRMVGA